MSEVLTLSGTHATRRLKTNKQPVIGISPQQCFLDPHTDFYTVCENVNFCLPSKGLAARQHHPATLSTEEQPPL